jgi:hypothetical protein
MSGVAYVGVAPTSGVDIETKSTTETILTAGISRGYVQGRVNTLVAAKATKIYVDTQDALYAPASYYASQDALLVPNAAKGVANGVASLDGSSKVPSAQVPILGAGFFSGPWGPNTAFGGTTSATPIKIAQWDLGVSGVTGQPLVFLSTSVQSTGGRPIIEVRIGDNTQTAYVTQTLIARGFGRGQYNDYQVIVVLPVTPDLAAHQDGIQDSYAPSTNLLLNAWLYDDSGGSSTTTSSSIATAALYFGRTAL